MQHRKGNTRSEQTKASRQDDNVRLQYRIHNSTHAPCPPPLLSLSPSLPLYLSKVFEHTHTHTHSLSINQILLFLLLLGRAAVALDGIVLGVGPARRLARVPLVERLLGDTVEQFLGEDAEELPSLVERLENGTLLISTCEKEKNVLVKCCFSPCAHLTLRAQNDVPWLTKPLSNLSKNSRASLSSLDRASSPTTAFMAAASRPMAYLAYSWLETSEWSPRVSFSPMADFIRRESEGRTLIGG